MSLTLAMPATVHGRETLMREILAAGDEIGNHSYHHPEYPGDGELAATDRKIDAATGFEPCLFRPPYGLIDGKVEAAARRNGLELVLLMLDSEDGLRARGFHFATVTELLGGRMLGGGVSPALGPGTPAR